MTTCVMCGAAIDGEARFCDGCKGQMAQPANASGPSAPRSLGSRAGELLAWVGLVGLIAAIAIPMFAPAAPPQSDLGTTVIGLMILAYVIARLRRAQRAWLYPLAALALVFLVFFAAGAMRGVRERRVSDELMSSIEAFDAGSAAQLKGVQNEPAAFQKLLAPALVRALARAPDSAVIAFDKGRMTMFATASGANVARCAAVVRGGGMSSLTRAERVASVNLIAHLFRAAAASPAAPEFDAEKARMLLTPLYTQADPQATVDNPTTPTALSNDEQCRVYMELLRGIHALTSADSALVIRYMAGVQAGR